MYSVNRTVTDSRGRAYLVVGTVDIDAVGARFAHLLARFAPPKVQKVEPEPKADES